MKWVDRILKHPDFIRYLELNAKAEKERKFCRHDLQHSLDVARVAYIIALEKGFDLNKETIYAAALLHDIGKWKQYLDKVDHALEGANLAEKILKDVGTDEHNIKIIIDAILCHRIDGEKDSPLRNVLYAGDKLCRICIQCRAIGECNRFDNGKQPVLEY